MTSKRTILTLLACSGALTAGLAGTAASPAGASVCQRQGSIIYCDDGHGTQVQCYWDAGRSQQVCVRVN